MTVLLVVLFFLSIACDVAGQICFKHGVDSLPDDGDGGFRFLSFIAAVVRSPWLWSGVAIYGAELVIWLSILARAPLSYAFPLASLNYCGVIIASRFLLGETVPRRRWLGAILITLGVAIVATGEA